jgi:hypothetical protein
MATGQSTFRPDNATISWLSQGLQSLVLAVPFKSFTPTSPSEPSLLEILAWCLTRVCHGTLARKVPPSRLVYACAFLCIVGHWSQRCGPVELPFGFDLSIDEIQNDFNIVKDGNPIAGLSTVRLLLRYSCSWLL